MDIWSHEFVNKLDPNPNLTLTTPHNSSIRSDEGLKLETSAF